MALPFLNKSFRLRNEIYLAGLMILFFIFRQSNPLFKYPFVLIYIWLVINLIIFKRESVFTKVRKFLVEFFLIIVLLLIICLSLFFSDKIFLSVFKDVINGILILSFFLILSFIVTSHEELLFFLNTFLKLIAIFAIVISIFGFLDLFGILPYKDYFLVEKNSALPFPYDYNFGLLPVLLGIMVLLYYILKRDDLFINNLIYSILAGIFSFFVCLSGSKRGIIILFLIIGVILVNLIISLFREKFLTKRIKLNLGIYILTLVFIVFCCHLFITRVSFLSKNNFLKFIKTRDLITTQERLSNNIFRINFLFCHNSQLKEIHEKLWSIKMESKDPDVGWAGINTHKTVFPLLGENVELVPRDAKGFLMDKSYKCDTWDGDAYAIANLGRFDVKNTQKVETSIFCYVSDDFNGDWAKLILLYTKNGEIHGSYDLQKKGTWQKISITDDCSNSTAEARFYFYKHGMTNFSLLSGYVILAYPQFTQTDEKGNSKSLYAEVTYSPGSFQNKIVMSSLINLTLLYFTEAKIITKGIDPIRNWIKKLIAEDTTYYGYKAKIEIDSVPGPFNDDRLAHGQFALQVFSKEFSWKQKLFGGGFNFLNWYGLYFMKDKTASDWPHNPFLSILLYSGIIGLLIYCFFIYKVFYYYLKYKKEYPLLFIFFLITFFFTFFSGGSPFDPPIMGFFVMLPFFIHSIHKKEMEESMKVTNAKTHSDKS